MQVANLYPPPEIPTAMRIEDIDLKNDLPRNDALVESNTTRVVRYLNGDPSFTHHLLLTIFAEVQMKSSTPLFICGRKRTPTVPRSFLTVKVGNERFVFLSRNARLYPQRDVPLKYPFKRINRYVAVKLDQDGAVQEINEAVKVFFHFQPDGEGVEVEAANLALRELSIVHQLQSDYTPRTFAVVKYMGNHAPILARFEQFIGQNLQQYYQKTVHFGTISVPIKLKIARDITKAVQYVHKKGIVHRDIKLENFLVQENGDTVRIFISDFGLSRHVQDEQSRQFKYGTFMWSAPEIAEITQNPTAVAAVDQKAELWSVGLIIYALSGLTHRSLTRLSEVNKLNKEIQKIQSLLELFKKLKSSQNEAEFRSAVQQIERATGIVIGNKDKETLLLEFDSQIMRLGFSKDHCMQTKQEKLDLWRSDIRANRQANASTLHELKAIAEQLLKIEPEKRASLEEIAHLLDDFQP